MQRMIEIGPLNPNWVVSIKSSPQGSENPMEEETGRVEEPEGTEDTKEARSFKHVRTNSETEAAACSVSPGLHQMGLYS